MAEICWIGVDYTETAFTAKAVRNALRWFLVSLLWCWAQYIRGFVHSWNYDFNNMKLKIFFGFNHIRVYLLTFFEPMSVVNREGMLKNQVVVVG